MIRSDRYHDQDETRRIDWMFVSKHKQLMILISGRVQTDNKVKTSLWLQHLTGLVGRKEEMSGHNVQCERRRERRSVGIKQLSFQFAGMKYWMTEPSVQANVSWVNMWANTSLLASKLVDETCRVSQLMLRLVSDTWIMQKYQNYVTFSSASVSFVGLSAG